MNIVLAELARHSQGLNASQRQLLIVSSRGQENAEAGSRSQRARGRRLREEMLSSICSVWASPSSIQLELRTQD